MVRSSLFAPAAVFALALAAPVAAQNAAVPAAHDSIIEGDYAGAERALLREAQFNPDSPEIKLNLAAIMVQTGRYAEARKLYDAVLAGPNADMELTRGRVTTAHAIAARGIAMANKPERQAVASR
ncbi:tetratricopeptide repeat protein [Sphingomonas sp. FW199]|uniref:tetratricopeptide repeat protein n=1 Tax=Sphingomonas sp. FW199 TaxID=3400217 RepID=UPI003CF77205